VVLFGIERGGHTWPGVESPVTFLGKTTKDISANDLLWEFFEKHPLQAPALASIDPPTDAVLPASFSFNRRGQDGVA